MKINIVYFLPFLFLQISCGSNRIEKVQLRKIEIHKNCDKPDSWLGVNIRYPLVTDSGGIKSKKINELILQEYNRVFRRISKFDLQEIDKLINESEESKCYEGYNFYANARQNDNGFLKITFETYHIENPVTRESGNGGEDSVLIDLNKEEIIRIKQHS